jgi:hypothetical protein
MRAHIVSAAYAVALSFVALVAMAACSGMAREAAAAANDVPESQMGKVYGEFEDQKLFEESLAASPEKRAWSEKQVWDGLSGATIQAKTFGKPVPDREVILGGKVLAYADGFGQYWLRLPPGPYELIGRCKGYRDAKAAVAVTPGSIQYLNFYLERR